MKLMDLNSRKSYKLKKRKKKRRMEASFDELQRLRKEVQELRAVCKNHPELWDRFYRDECSKTLKRSVFFRNISDEYVEMLSKKCQRVEYAPGTLLCKEGEPWTQKVKFFASGEVERWTEKDGVHVTVKSLDPASVGTMHLLLDEPARFSVVTQTDTVCYEISREDFADVITQYPQLMLPVATSLAKYIRSEHRGITAGLFHQKGIVQKHEKTAYVATGLAVFVESFYRSAMNNVINAQLDGKAVGPPSTWFPKMHVQIPTRIVYITGLKELRRHSNEIEFRDSKYFSPGVGRLLLSFVPGVAMCPLSSVLEATHARQNTESMMIRWTRGFAPRLVREIVFGIGINQLSDYCRELVPAGVENQHARTAFGSIAAGIMSGYCSQIPHNLSTMKLMDPTQSYKQLWNTLWNRSLPRVPSWIEDQMARDAVARLMTVAMPLGGTRRSCQIAGSFIVINGLIYRWREMPWP